MSHSECQSDRSKRIVLQNAVRGRDWAFIVLSNSYAASLKYKELLNQLENAQQQAVFHRSVKEDDANTEFRPSRWKNPANTNYADQRRYTRTPTSSRNIVPRSGLFERSPTTSIYDGSASPTKGTALQRDFTQGAGTCHNCGLPIVAGSL